MKEIMIVKSILIDKPLEEVFEFISNYNNDPLWRREVVEMHVGRIPPETGDEITGVIVIMGQERRAKATISEYEKNKLIVSEVTEGPVYVRGYRLVSQTGPVVKFTYSATTRFIGLKEVISGLIIKNFIADMERNLPELKRILESKTVSKLA